MLERQAVGICLLTLLTRMEWTMEWQVPTLLVGTLEGFLNVFFSSYAPTHVLCLSWACWARLLCQAKKKNGNKHLLLRSCNHFSFFFRGPVGKDGHSLVLPVDIQAVCLVVPLPCHCQPHGLRGAGPARQGWAVPLVPHLLKEQRWACAHLLA